MTRLGTNKLKDTTRMAPQPESDVLLQVVGPCRVIARQSRQLDVDDVAHRGVGDRKRETTARHLV